MPADTSEVRRASFALRAHGARARALAGTAMTKVVADTKRDAQALCPVDTGNLRSSISGTTTRTATGAVGEVGPTAAYGIFVELGTSRMAGQPYLTPAFDRNVATLEHALDSLGGLQ